MRHQFGEDVLLKVFGCFDRSDFVGGQIGIKVNDPFFVDTSDVIRFHRFADFNDGFQRNQISLPRGNRILQNRRKIRDVFVFERHLHRNLNIIAVMIKNRTALNNRSQTVGNFTAADAQALNQFSVVVDDVLFGFDRLFDFGVLIKFVRIHGSAQFFGNFIAPRVVIFLYFNDNRRSAAVRRGSETGFGDVKISVLQILFFDFGFNGGYQFVI